MSHSEFLENDAVFVAQRKAEIAPKSMRFLCQKMKDGKYYVYSSKLKHLSPHCRALKAISPKGHDTEIEAWRAAQSNVEYEKKLLDQQLAEANAKINEINDAIKHCGEHP